MYTREEPRISVGEPEGLAVVARLRAVVVLGDGRSVEAAYIVYISPDDPLSPEAAIVYWQDGELIALDWASLRPFLARARVRLEEGRIVLEVDDDG